MSSPVVFKNGLELEKEKISLSLKKLFSDLLLNFAAATLPYNPNLPSPM
jgi:hypothetical protein